LVQTAFHKPFLIDKYIPTQTFEPNSRPKWLNSSTLKAIKQNIKHGTPTKLLTAMMTMLPTPQRETLLLLLLLLLSKGQNQTLNSNLSIVLKQNLSVFWKCV